MGERILYVSPQGGFCDRLRVLSSVYIMAREFDYDMVSLWDGSEATSSEEPMIKKFNVASIADHNSAANSIFRSGRKFESADLLIVEWLPNPAPPACKAAWVGWEQIQTAARGCDIVAPGNNAWTVMGSLKAHHMLPKTIVLQTSREAFNPDWSYHANCENRRAFYQDCLYNALYKFQLPLYHRLARTDDLESVNDDLAKLPSNIAEIIREMRRQISGSAASNGSPLDASLVREVSVISGIYMLYVPFATEVGPAPWWGYVWFEKAVGAMRRLFWR